MIEIEDQPWREMVAHAQSNEWIDPFKRAGARHSDRSRPLEAKIAKVDRAIDCE